MTTKTDGGPAFPVADTSACQVGSADELDAVARGMTLRDYFAAQVIGHLVISQFRQCNDTESDVRYAYQVADAMLKEKNRT